MITAAQSLLRHTGSRFRLAGRFHDGVQRQVGDQRQIVHDGDLSPLHRREDRRAAGAEG